MPTIYTIIFAFIGLILAIWVMLFSLRIFRIVYTWKQFWLLMLAVTLYNLIVSSILYGWNIRVEDVSIYIMLPIILLELWLIYGIFRFLKISVTLPKYIGIIGIQCIYGIILISISLFFSVFIIHGASMAKTYYDGDMLFVNKLTYMITSPKYGDIVVVRPGRDKIRESYIKRVIATPGDTIRFESGSVFLKTAWSSGFQKLDEPFLTEANIWKTYLPEYVDDGPSFTLPENSYWVMGDNRNNSADSRSCFRNCSGLPVEAHYISRENIVGKVIGKL